jgi:hypothetical protein
MKKSAFIYISITLTLMLNSCSSGVPKSDYESLQNELSTAQSKIEQLENELKESDKKYNEALDTISDLQISSVSYGYALIWAKAAFGEDVICGVVKDKYLYVIVPTNQDVTSEMITELYDDILVSVKTLGAMYTKYKDSFDYSIINISFLDSTNNAIFESQLINDGKGYSAGATLISLTGTDLIYDGLSKALE